MPAWNRAPVTASKRKRVVPRLSGEQIGALVDRLTCADAASTLVDIGDVRQKLEQLCEGGKLAPALTQRLAAYLNRPVRCSAPEPRAFGPERIAYAARSDGIEFRLTFDALLASSLADAMIGGEGEASKVGLAPRVTRVAAGCAAKMLAVIAEALELAAPSPADYEPHAADGEDGVSGSLGIGSQSYAWRLNVASSNEPRTPALPKARERSVKVRLPSASAPAHRGAEEALAEAVERARAALEPALHGPLAFHASKAEELTSAGLPPGWLRVAIPVRAGGAIILSVDRASAAAMINAALDSDVAGGPSLGILAETGAETIVLCALRAFAASLARSPDEMGHAMRLGDDAILAALPHRRVETVFRVGSRKGTLVWLVPSTLLHAHA